MINLLGGNNKKASHILSFFPPFLVSFTRTFLIVIPLFGRKLLVRERIVIMRMSKENNYDGNDNNRTKSSENKEKLYGKSEHCKESCFILSLNIVLKFA